MRKRTLAAEFAIQVFSDHTIDWNGFQDYLWRRIADGPEKALRASRRKAKRGSGRRRAR